MPNKILISFNLAPDATLQSVTDWMKQGLREFLLPQEMESLEVSLVKGVKDAR